MKGYIKSGLTRRNCIPRAAFRQRRWFTFYNYKLYWCIKKCRNVGDAALKFKRLPRHRAGPFRKNENILSAFQRLFALAQHGFGITVIADIARRAHHPAEIGVGPEFMLDDALHIRHARHQEDRIQQGGMIGNDQRAMAFIQLFHLVKAGIDNAAHPQEINESAKGMIDNPPHPADSRLLIAGEQRNCGKDENRHENAADAEHRESKAGAEQSPDIVQTLTHDGGTTSPLRRRTSSSQRPPAAGTG